MKQALLRTVYMFFTEIAEFAVLYFFLVLLKIMTLDINWAFLLAMLVLLFLVQFAYFGIKSKPNRSR